MATPSPRLPPWLKVKLPGDGHFAAVRRSLAHWGLSTVCQEARCPNMAECWAAGTATFLILGEVCTRSCRFCAVTSGKPQTGMLPAEPDNLARAAAAMKLRHVVVTSVNRDDLPDGGALQFVRTVQALAQHVPRATVELLTPDFAGDRPALTQVARSGAAILGHNLETVRALTRRIRDVRCSYDRSLAVLRAYRALAPNLIVKSSLLLGFGETPAEVREALNDLRQAGVDWLTLGQYLRPSRRQVAVERFIEPALFAELAAEARALGFPLVSAGPLVRSSYRAGECQVEKLLAQRQGAALQAMARGG